MKKEFWIEKWQNKQIGFHKDFTHPLLIQYLQLLKLSKGDTVFVPLCGKSIDMLWLNDQGYQVIGVELSELAIEEFIDENKLKATQDREGGFKIYHFENITIYQGDFFAMNKEIMSSVNAVYDRAALIALPDDLVKKYSTKMLEIIPKSAKQLLITLEMNRKTGSLGPPFSTSSEKVKRLYGASKSIQLVQEVDIIEREEHFQKQGCEFVYERVYLIE